VLARYCYRKSSVRLSVTLRFRGHIVLTTWCSSKLITRISSLGLRSLEPQHRQSSPRGTPRKFGWNSGNGGVALLSRKPAISLKRGKIWSRLLLMTNRKSHTPLHAFGWCQNQRRWMTLNFKNTCTFRRPPRKFEWRKTHTVSNEDVAQ